MRYSTSALFAMLALTGCYSAYVAPTTAESSAELHLNGANQASLVFRIWDNPQCKESPGFGNITGFIRGITNTEVHRIPAGKPVYLEVAVSDLSYTSTETPKRCVSLQTFIPEPGGRYKASLGLTEQNCSATIAPAEGANTSFPQGYRVIARNKACM